MKPNRTSFLGALMATFIAVGTTMAGPFEDGIAAHKRGDYVTALRLLRPLAEQGNASAQLRLGAMSESGQGVPQDYVEALKWFRKAADQGNGDAQFNLGLLYEKGKGVAQDKTEALRWFRKAA